MFLMDRFFSRIDFPEGDAEHCVHQPPTIANIYYQTLTQFRQVLDESTLYNRPFFQGFVEGYLQVLQKTAHIKTGTYRDRLRFFQARLRLSDKIWYDQHLHYLSENGIDEQGVRINPFDIQRRWRPECRVDEDDVLGRTLVEYTLFFGSTVNKILIPENTPLRFHATSEERRLFIEMPGGVTMDCQQNCFPPYGILIHSDTVSRFED
jgi:hypothetical protein